MAQNPLGPRFITVTGVLSPDGRLLLQRGFLVDDPGSLAGLSDSRLWAEMLDEAGRLRLRVPLTVSAVIEEPRGPDGETRLRGGGYEVVADAIPFPEGTRTIRFVDRGVLVHEQAVSIEGPRVELTWRPADIVRGVHRLTWAAEHPDGKDLTFLVAYSSDEGRTWLPLTLPTDERELEIDFDQVAGGEGRLRLLATDGANTTAVETAPFTVTKKGVVPTIHAPIDGSVLAAGQPAFMLGQGYNLEAGVVESDDLRWVSSEDGPLGTGAFVYARLSRGRHRITLRAGDAGSERESVVTVDVGDR